MVAGIALFSGCGEGPLLPDTSKNPVLLILPNKGFFGRRDILPLQIQERSSTSTWTDFEAALTDSSGRILQSWRGLYSQGPDFSLEVPEDLDTATLGELLELKVTVFDRRMLLTEAELEFFLVDELPPISGTTHPMTVYPGSRVLLDILGEEPWPKKSWVRWSWNGKVIHEGPWSTSSVYRWETPAGKEGSFAPKAEIFPKAPARGTFVFDSPLMRDFPVVSTLQEPENYGPRELNPASSYSLLYHFRGNLRNTGTMANPGDIPPWDNLDIDVASGIFGVRFLPGSGIQVPGNPFPLNDKGEIQAFSVTVSGVLGEKPEGRVYELSSEGEELKVILTLSQREWILDFYLGTIQKQIRKTYVPSEVFSQTLSFIPSGSGAEILWFHDASLVGFAVAAWDKVPVLKSGGKALLGGEESFRGILDEFGIYYRDGANRPAADGRLLEHQLMSLEAGSLAWVAGFDGSYLDENFTSSEKAYLTRGSLKLPPGEWLESPVLEESIPGMVLILPAEISGNFQMSLVDADGNEIRELVDSMALKAAMAASAEITDRIRFTVLFQEDTPDDPFTMAVPPPQSPYRLKIAAEEGATSVLDFIICEKILPPEVVSSDEVSPLEEDSLTTGTDIQP